jgi:DNA-binding MarR family transcriptional regulator
MPDLKEMPAGCTCFRLRKMSRAVSRLYDHHMAQVGLKTTQFSVLRNCARQPRPMAELAAHMAIERTTLTRNLKPLVDAGWIALKPGADSRQRIVTITPTGLAKIEEAANAWRAAQDKIELILGGDAVLALHRQLDTALAAITPYLEELPHADTD